MKIIDQPEEKKRRRYNKNKKKAWRKKIDISEFEDALEDQRRAERLGDLQDRTSDELFQLDFREESKTLEDQKLKRKKASKKGDKTKSLKCHQYLDGLPGVKAISKPRPQCKQYPSKVMRTAINRSGDSLKDELKRLIANDQRKSSRLKDKQQTVPQSKKAAKTDLWKNGIQKTMKKNPFGMMNPNDLTFIERSLEHYKSVTKESLIRAPKMRKVKPNKIPALIAPHPGMSYNPSSEDLKNLKEKAAKEQKKKKLLLKREKATLLRYLPSRKNAPTQESYLKEMSQGLVDEEQIPDQEDETEETQNKDEKNCLSVSSSKVLERKTKQQRVKERRVKVAQKQRESAKRKKIEQNNVFKVKSYLKEIKTETKMKAKKLSAKKKILEKKKYSMTGRLARVKFVEQELKVPDKIPKSLRQVASIGNLFVDRTKSLQRRNIIEPNESRTKPKKNVKQYIKYSKDKAKIKG